VPSVLPYEFRLDQDALPDLPDDGDARKAVLKTSHEDQEWRAAYVAVTRARHLLIASGAFWTGGARPRTPSPLFEIIDALATPAPDRCADAGEAPVHGAPTGVTAAPDPVFAGGWRAAVAAAAFDAAVPRALASGPGSWRRTITRWISSGSPWPGSRAAPDVADPSHSPLR